MKDGRIRGYDCRLAVIVTVSTFVLILEHYYHIGPEFPEITPLVFYVFIPLSVSYMLSGEKPSDFGICAGDWKLGLVLVVVSLSVMAVVIYAVADLHDFENYYRLPENTNWGKLIVDAALYMFSWEFIFRGYMLFGMEKTIGRSAIFVQAIPFALLHIGKPELEALTTLFGGYILGYISYRTRSFLPCFVIHFGLYIMMRAFAVY